jgi:NAD(P)-dependent dehydrogenase (short-subunit alcohol dehydrogenase family)
MSTSTAGKQASRIVIITGAAKGIGLACAQHFADLGDQVVLLDQDQDAVSARALDLSHAGNHATGFALDVTNEASVANVITSVMTQFGKIDVLVNNAGIGDQTVATTEQNLEAFDRVLSVHLRGTFLLSREVAKIMLTQRAGSIVNLASIAALAGIAGRNAYSAAKAGIVAMTRSMACEWASQGIRVNAVAPGYVRSELVNKLIQAGALDEEKIRQRTPMGRFGEPIEIAQAIAFLASPQASFITGTTLSVDGGWIAQGAAL